MGERLRSASGRLTSDLRHTSSALDDDDGRRETVGQKRTRKVKAFTSALRANCVEYVLDFIRDDLLESCFRKIWRGELIRQGVAVDDPELLPKREESGVAFCHKICFVVENFH